MEQGKRAVQRGGRSRHNHSVNDITEALRKVNINTKTSKKKPPPGMEPGPAVPSAPKQSAYQRQHRQDTKLFVLEVPEPTPAYLARANEPYVLLKEPQQLLIVLDLNGTLLAKTGSSRGYHPRQFVVEFLRLFEQAGLPVPGLIWDRSHFGLTAQQYEAHVQVYKQLSMVWESAEVRAVGGSTIFDQTNTILVDDTIEKAASEPHNILLINEFTPQQTQYCELGQVVQYLEKVRCYSNVSAYMKEHPFALDSDASHYNFDALFELMTKQEKLLRATPTADEREEDHGSTHGQEEEDKDGGGVKLVRE